MVVNKLGRRNLLYIGTLFACLVGLFALAVAPPAGAQGTPAFCEEYPENPECDVEPQPPVDNPDPGPGELPSADGGSASVGGDGSGDGDGSLPFTGYPLTVLILLLLVLLAMGLALRSATALRERFARGPSDA